MKNGAAATRANQSRYISVIIAQETVTVSFLLLTGRVSPEWDLGRVGQTFVVTWIAEDTA